MVEFVDLEFGAHGFLINHVFLPTEQAETNICWIIYQDASFKICLSLFGWKENIVPKMHIVHCRWNLRSHSSHRNTELQKYRNTQILSHKLSHWNTQILHCRWNLRSPSSHSSQTSSPSTNMAVSQNVVGPNNFWGWTMDIVSCNTFWSQYSQVVISFWDCNIF